MERKTDANIRELKALRSSEAFLNLPGKGNKTNDDTPENLKQIPLAKKVGKYFNGHFGLKFDRIEKELQKDKRFFIFESKQTPIYISFFERLISDLNEKTQSQIEKSKQTPLNPRSSQVNQYQSEINEKPQIRVDRPKQAMSTKSIPMNNSISEIPDKAISQIDKSKYAISVRSIQTINSSNTESIKLAKKETKTQELNDCASDDNLNESASFRQFKKKQKAQLITEQPLNKKTTKSELNNSNPQIIAKRQSARIVNLESFQSIKNDTLKKTNNPLHRASFNVFSNPRQVGLYESLPLRNVETPPFEQSPEEMKKGEMLQNIDLKNNHENIFASDSKLIFRKRVTTGGNLNSGSPLFGTKEGNDIDDGIVMESFGGLKPTSFCPSQTKSVVEALDNIQKSRSECRPYNVITGFDMINLKEDLTSTMECNPNIPPSNDFVIGVENVCGTDDILKKPFSFTKELRTHLNSTPKIDEKKPIQEESTFSPNIKIVKTNSQKKDDSNKNLENKLSDKKFDEKKKVAKIITISKTQPIMKVSTKKGVNHEELRFEMRSIIFEIIKLAEKKAKENFASKLSDDQKREEKMREDARKSEKRLKHEMRKILKSKIYEIITKIMPSGSKLPSFFLNSERQESFLLLDSVKKLISRNFAAIDKEIIEIQTSFDTLKISNLSNLEKDFPFEISGLCLIALQTVSDDEIKEVLRSERLSNEMANLFRLFYFLHFEQDDFVDFEQRSQKTFMVEVIQFYTDHLRHLESGKPGKYRILTFEQKIKLEEFLNCHKNLFSVISDTSMKAFFHAICFYTFELLFFYGLKSYVKFMEKPREKEKNRRNSAYQMAYLHQKRAVCQMQLEDLSFLERQYDLK